MFKPDTKFVIKIIALRHYSMGVCGNRSVCVGHILSAEWSPSEYLNDELEVGGFLIDSGFVLHPNDVEIISINGIPL